MSVIIFVWDANKGASTVGHASLSTTSPKQYISLWPGKPKKDNKLNLFKPSAERYAVETMREDRAENERIPDYASARISGLDEEKIVSYWQSLKRDYNLYTHNCSTVVLKALEAGGFFELYPEFKHHICNDARHLRGGVVTTPAVIRRIGEHIDHKLTKSASIKGFSFMDHLVNGNCPH